MPSMRSIGRTDSRMMASALSTRRKRSADARKKSAIVLIYTIDCELADEAAVHVEAEQRPRRGVRQRDRPLVVQRDDTFAHGGKHGLERGDVGSGGRVGHADDLDPMGAQQCLEVEVTGIVDQHGIAGAQQETTQQVERLGAGAGQQQLVGRRLNAVFGKTGQQQPAQRKRTTRIAVVR